MFDAIRMEKHRLLYCVIQSRSVKLHSLQPPSRLRYKSSVADCFMMRAIRCEYSATNETDDAFAGFIGVSSHFLMGQFEVLRTQL